jgi:hypothetical protein
MGPLLSAALAGDVELVKSLVEAKCQALPKPGFHRGISMENIWISCGFTMILTFKLLFKVKLVIYTVKCGSTLGVIGCAVFLAGCMPVRSIIQFWGSNILLSFSLHT